MKVKFWGVRGSLPTPPSAATLQDRLTDVLCAVGPLSASTRREARAAVRELPVELRGTSGGNTPCVEVRAASGDLLILDAGTGIRPLGNCLMEEAEFAEGRGRAWMLLSHTHWDHLGGLARFLESRGDVPLYVPEGIPRHLRIELSNRADVTVTGTEDGSRVVPGIRTTASIGDKLKEQALVVDAGSGVLVVTGCCHPGLGPTLEAASLHGRVRGILGGLHEAKGPEQLSGLSLVAPCHCTKEPDRFPELFPRAYQQVGVGSVVAVETAPGR